MTTRRALEDKLISAATKAGGHPTNRVAVNAPLRENPRLIQPRAAIEAMSTEDLGDVVEPPP